MATDEIRAGAEDFNSQGIDPLRAKRASDTWLSPITTCKGTALKIVQSTYSPCAAWRELLQRYRACGWKEKSRLMREFKSLKMELGENPKNFTMRVDRVARELQRVGKAVDEDKNPAILNGLTQEYVIEQRMLEGGDDEPTRAHIDKVILNQYERLKAEKSEAGMKTLAVVVTPVHHKPQPAPSNSKWGKQRSKFDGECSKCGRRGHRGEEGRGGKQKNSTTAASSAAVRSTSLLISLSVGKGRGGTNKRC